MALPRERGELSQIKDLGNGLGPKGPIESHQQFSEGPKPPQSAENAEAADAGHIDGSKKAFVGHEEAQQLAYHGTLELAKAGPPITNRLDGWKWAKAVRGSAELTDGDKVVAWELLDRLNWQTLRLDPAAETVARGTGRRARAVQRSILALAAEGFLKKAEASAGRRTNAYSLHFPIALPSATTSDKTGLEMAVPASTTSGETRLRVPARPATPSEMTPNHVRADTQTLENLSVPTPEAPSHDDGFETFWTIWGRHEDKGRARLQWQRAIRRLGILPETIIDAARAYRLERAGKGREAWEAPALWLRREAYADDQQRKPPAPARASSQIFLEEGSEGLRAWDEHHQRATGRRSGYPRTCHRGKDGWWFDAPFPPSIEKRAA